MNIPSKHLALVGLLIAVPMSAWAVAYNPMNNAIHEVADEIRNRTTLLEHYEEVNAQYRELRALTKMLESATAEARTRIPSQPDAEQWLESTSVAARDAGLLVRSVTTSGQRIEGEFGILPVDVNVFGTFESVYILLQHLEKMDRITRVDRMNIHKVKDDLVEARFIVHLLFANGGGS